MFLMVAYLLFHLVTLRGLFPSYVIHTIGEVLRVYGGHYTISLNDNLTDSFRMTVKSGMMRDPTLFNQTDILNEKFLAQYTTSCRAQCKHERCTRVHA